MGLMDILNGMQNGPRGQKQPTPPGQGGGMSPIMMALLGLLAYKAMKGFGGGGASAGTPPPSLPPGTRTAESGGGGLGDILGGMLGGPGGSAGRAGAPGGGGLGGGGLGDILGGMLGGGRPGGGTTAGSAGAPGGGLGEILGGMLGGARRRHRAQRRARPGAAGSAALGPGPHRAILGRHAARTRTSRPTISPMRSAPTPSARSPSRPACRVTTCCRA